MEDAQIVRKIRNAGIHEIDAYLDAAMERKQELYPNWWLQYVALPLEKPEICRATAKEAIKYLEMYAADGQMGMSGVK